MLDASKLVAFVSVMGAWAYVKYCVPQPSSLAASSSDAVASYSQRLRTPSSSFATDDYSDATTTTTIDSKKDAYAEDPPLSDNERRIVWLMSFPNSGTSYTTRLVRETTLRNTATNYGEEGLTDDRGGNVPVLSQRDVERLTATSSSSSSGSSSSSSSSSSDVGEGPFWNGWHDAPTDQSALYPESGYILTKTHCGGRCGNCGPDLYVETERSFKLACLSGKRRVPPSGGASGKKAGASEGKKKTTTTKTKGSDGGGKETEEVKTTQKQSERTAHADDDDDDDDGNHDDDGAVNHDTNDDDDDNDDDDGNTDKERRLLTKDQHHSLTKFGQSLETTRYSPALVSKAVHIFRDPYDNVVARFHLALKKQRKEGNDDFALAYSNDRDGFRKWCADLDKNAKFHGEEVNSRFIDEDVRDAFKGVLCHGDFYRYVQWHNLAFRTTESMDIPVHVIHYEEYGTKFDETTSRLFEFLHLTPVTTPTEFVAGKSYKEYFTAEERDAAGRLVKMLSTRRTWRELEVYF